MPSGPPYFLVVGALLLTQVLFGINYVAAKIVVSAIPPLAWASIRAILTALLLFLTAYHRPFPKGGKTFFHKVFFFSLIGVSINQGCFLLGLSHTSATNAAILNTLIPVFAISFIVLFGKESLSRTKVFGFLSAFIGALVVLRVEKFQLSNETMFGDILVICNTISFGLYLALSKDFLQKNDRLWVTFWQFLLGGFLLTLLAFPQWVDFKMPVLNQQLVVCMVFVILGGSFLPYLLNNWALAHTEASRVALYVFVQPAITSLVASLWFGETLTPRTLFGTGFIFLGAYLANQKVKKPPVSPVPA